MIFHRGLRTQTMAFCGSSTRWNQNGTDLLSKLTTLSIYNINPNRLYHLIWTQQIVLKEDLDTNQLHGTDHTASKYFLHSNKRYKWTLLGRICSPSVYGETKELKEQHCPVSDWRERLFGLDEKWLTRYLFQTPYVLHLMPLYNFHRSPSCIVFVLLW